MEAHKIVMTCQRQTRVRSRSWCTRGEPEISSRN